MEKKETTFTTDVPGSPTEKPPKTEIIFTHISHSNSLNNKIGLDTPIIVYLIAYPKIYNEMWKKVFEREGIFYVHEISLKEDIEIKKILVEEYGHDKSKVDKEANDFLKKHNIQIVKTKGNKKEIAQAREQDCVKAGIKAHPPDSIMISDFIEEGISTVFSEDGSYIAAAHHLGLNAERILFKLDHKIQEKFGKLSHFKIKNKGFKR